jgi:hypothetical protein
MKVIISLSELKIAFESIPFIKDHEDRDVITISHPRFRDDGHKIPITFKKVILGGQSVWQLAGDNIIVNEFKT